MLEYRVSARRIDEHGGIETCKQAELPMDTDPQGRIDAFNPAELFLASIAACMLKGIERVKPLIHFHLEGVEILLRARRQDAPPRILSVSYEIIVDSDESDQRLDLLHTNVRKYGTIFNTVSDAVGLSGTVRRKD